MRFPSLVVVAVLGQVGFSQPADAQAPSNERAWGACQSWVRRALYDPPALRFPEIGTESVRVRMVPGAPRRRWEIQSHAELPDTSGTIDVLPFTCTIEYGTTSLDNAAGYSWKRLVLPDTTVRLPAARRGRAR